MAKNNNLTDFLTDLADGIRAAEGTTEIIDPQDFRDRVENMVATVTSDANATAGNILSGKTAYVDGVKVTGTIPTKTSSDLTTSDATVGVPAGYYPEAVSKSVATGSAKTPNTTVSVTPSISIDSTGKITASASGSKSVTPTVSAGYVSSGTAGTITVSGSNTKQLTTQAAQTITPGTSNKTIDSGRYLTGTQTIKGDSNLVTGNIKNGVSIFGVTGTYAGITPSGRKNIYSNGSYDITNYAEVYVSVPTGITPSGTINITLNGTWDVTNYASATVNVASVIDLQNEYAFLNFASTSHTYELTGHLFPCTYNQWLAAAGTDYALTDAETCTLLSTLTAIGDTYGDLGPRSWQSTTNGMLVPKNTNFIIWSTSTTPPSASGLTVTEYGGYQRTMVNTFYYGYLCKITSNSVILF